MTQEIKGAPQKEPTKPEPSEKVEVSKSLLQDIQTEMTKLKKTNEMLLQIADKKQLARYYQRNQQDLPKMVKLRMLRGKVILGWWTVEDLGSFKDARGIWTEKQSIGLILEDGSKVEKIDYRKYVRSYELVDAKVLSTKDEDGKITLKVQRTDNNKQYEIGVEFVN